MNKAAFSWLAGLSFALTVLAGEGRADVDDPPSRVARIAFAEGSVSFQPSGTQDWVAAPLNRPLSTGDTLWSDQRSRVELQLDSSIVRLSSSSELSFVNLSDDVTQVQVSSGTLLLSVRRLGDNETYEIDTPNLAFSVLRPGTYRISVDASGSNTTISTRNGQGEATGGGSAYSLYAGDSVVFSGTDHLRAEAQAYAADQDAFGAWSDDRDRRSDRSESARYVSPDVVGYQDLDEHGSWRSTPNYGHVWYPRQVSPGWAPYHAGHWSYIEPWGYTWVDDEPWGFAPFHYGRWIFAEGAWGWVPAPPRPERGPYLRPVYAPALVAWVGAGAGIAWFALGPREVYVPSYPVSQNYARNVNVSNTTVNTTVINNRTVNVTYVNRTAPGAITATSAQAFSSAQPVAKNLVKVDERMLAVAQASASTPVLVPTKQAVLGSPRPAAVRPPQSVQSRSVVARTPPPPPPVAFERRQEAIKNNGGKPLSVAQVREIQPVGAASRTAAINVAPPAAPVTVAKTAKPEGAKPAAPPPPAAPPITPVSRPAPEAIHPRELPPVPKTASPSAANSVLDREHLQQQQQLRAQQDAERQRVQQQQELEHQRLAKQQAEATRNQGLERQHAQQTQELQQKHIQEQQQLQAKQQEQKQSAKPVEKRKP